MDVLDKPIYGHWSGIATMWCALIVFDVAGAAFDLIFNPAMWYMAILMLALLILGTYSLIHELYLLNAGREREQASIVRHQAIMADIDRRSKARWN